MAVDLTNAKRLLKEWKGDNYAFGFGVLDETGRYARSLGKRTLVIANLGANWALPIYERVAAALGKNGVEYEAISDARPNAPYEDVFRMANEIAKMRPDSVIAIGGGSTIDAAKAASVLAAYSPSQIMEHLGASPELASTPEPFFGVGFVTAIKEATGIVPTPIIAVQTAASSGAHLTRYANITNPETGQKKLFIDDANVPARVVFDYGVTLGAPRELTMDGSLDGISHLWEVFTGATGKDYYDRVKDIATEGIALIVNHLPKAMEQPDDREAREALGIGTDLGGYAIMIGTTNGGHIGSFSLVDVTTHGRAVAILDIYYTVFFSPMIQDQLRTVGWIYHNAGYISRNLDGLEGRELGQAVADGMAAFARAMGFPTTLREVGTTEEHIKRMIAAAKNPQLDSKMKGMPISLDPAKGDVEKYMQPVLEAALTGDFSKIKLLES